MTSNQIDVFLGQLCGLQMNSPFDDSVWEIKPETKGLPVGFYSFESLSLWVNVKEGLLKGFAVLTSNKKGFKCWSWLYDGRPISLSRSTSPSELEMLMGQPIESWDDGVEICQTFLVTHATMRCLWDIHQRLKSVEWDAC